MRVVNENMETITEYDLTKGYLIPALVIKEDATPIDNETKFAWADEDYEDAQMYIVGERPGVGTVSIDERMSVVEQQLSAMESAYAEGVQEA